MEALALDHVGYVGPRLGALRDAWRRLGFLPTEPRALAAVDAADGRVSLDQQSAHVVFGRGYVELTAVHSSDPAHHLARYARRYDGVHIVAFAARDASAAYRAAASEGLELGPLSTAARRVDYGANPGEARFRWFMPTPDASPEVLLCVVEHLTPERVFQPEVQRHPNGALALRRCTIVSDAPGVTAARLRALGVPSGSREVEVVSPAVAAARWPGAALPPAPCVAAVTIEVEDLACARARVEAGDVPVAACPDGFWVSPSDATGAVLEFVSA